MHLDAIKVQAQLWRLLLCGNRVTISIDLTTQTRTTARRHARVLGTSTRGRVARYHGDHCFFACCCALPLPSQPIYYLLHSSAPRSTTINPQHFSTFFHNPDNVSDSIDGSRTV